MRNIIILHCCLIPAVVAQSVSRSPRNMISIRVAIGSNPSPTKKILSSCSPSVSIFQIQQNSVLFSSVAQSFYGVIKLNQDIPNFLFFQN